MDGVPYHEGIMRIFIGKAPQYIQNHNIQYTQFSLKAQEKNGEPAEIILPRRIQTADRRLTEMQLQLSRQAGSCGRQKRVKPFLLSEFLPKSAGRNACVLLKSATKIAAIAEAALFHNFPDAIVGFSQQAFGGGQTAG